MKRSASENIWLVIKYVLLIGFTILCVYPLVWLFLASLKRMLNCIRIHGDYRNSGQ